MIIGIVIEFLKYRTELTHDASKYQFNSDVNSLEDNAEILSFYRYLLTIINDACKIFPLTDYRFPQIALTPSQHEAVLKKINEMASANKINKEVIDDLTSWRDLYFRNYRGELLPSNSEYYIPTSALTPKQYAQYMQVEPPEHLSKKNL